MINQFLEQNKNLNIIFLTKFGSHLYGTNTENSDEDYKGVFLPTTEQCVLNKIPKSITFNSGDNDSKNSSEDIDIEIYSIQYYLKLLQKGDTGALDILHAKSNKDVVVKESDLWDYLYKNRSEFYTTNLSAFVGYCRAQASKYGIKGSRLNDAKMIIDLFKQYDPDERLSQYWDELPETEHIKKIKEDKDLGYDFPLYQVCGRKIQSTVTFDYALGIVEKFYSEYGKRARLAAENKGIDWKALSHAMRCAIEMESVYEFGDIKFPLTQAEYLLSIKKGELDYQDTVSPAIEMRMDYIEELVRDSKYPEKVNMKRWEEWLIKIYNLNGRES